MSEYKCNLTKSRQRLKNHFNSKQKIRGRTIRLSLRTGRGSVAGLYFACLFFFLTLTSKQALRPLNKPVFFGTRFLRLKSSSVYFFDSELLVELMAIFCSRFQKKERKHRPMVLLRKSLTNRAPVANTFSTLSNLKSTLNRSF